MLAPSAVIDGRYLIRRQLGVGGQGEAYEVGDLHEGDVVALKLLTALPLGGGPWVEARILRRLADPHILPIRNADLAAGQPYLVTELATHGTIGDRLSAVGLKGLDTDEVVRWIRQACHGIARAHDLQLLHNDIKPANLFLNKHRECLVADFGFAALIPTGSNVTLALGATPETVAPEVAAAWGTPVPTASVASDVYSLGATAYWLLAGKPPQDFGGLPDVPAMMALVASQSPPRLRDIAPHVPGYVATALERAMARNPSDRFPTVTELAAALGARPAVSRKWRRTDEHVGHIGCWRGEAPSSVYVLCLEHGPRATQGIITTRHLTSGRRVTPGCRGTPLRSWSQAIRTIMRRLK